MTKPFTRREALASGTALAAFGLAGHALAQPGAAPGGAAMMSTGVDPVMAFCLLGMGKKQIAVCRFAMPKLSTPDVKAFAQAEIDEHETMKQKLMQLGYAPPAGMPMMPAGGAPPRMGNAQVMVGRHPLPPGTADWAMIDAAVQEQCIATETAELGKKEGMKFEKAFVGGQLHAHYGLFDHGVTYRKFASAQMAPVLDEARTIIEQHIATCKQLMDKLEAMKDHAG